MTPLKTESLDLDFKEQIAHMSVSGVIDAESMREGLDWLTQAGQEHGAFNIHVRMAKADFPDLGAVSKGFRAVADVLRAVPGADKCAVVTDSMFIRNTAKVEGAVIPGLTIRAFGSDEDSYAEAWLKGESLSDVEDDAPDATYAKADAAETKPAPKTKPEPSANPWDKLKMSNVDY
ncbi:SpoIIAA family protein [Robiginitomaculum antarcticum]|uniref:STAS/SEC14 domain-containing protein n=1 Tax=Robiginitomaculum antarcticum TaxID=437507 RepID=UPI00036FC39D|nr:STAS/SEC14 domain-containing protein [Robiginitomaculum antarcticum]